MVFIITAFICIIFFILCYINTGTDEKNLKSYSSYPQEVQNRIQKIEEYKNQLKIKNKTTIFLTNMMIFLVILFLVGLIIREKDFWHNFFNLSVIGQGINLFDLFVIDLLWWRHTKRIRFTKIPEKSLYQNPQKHFEAFFRAFIMYFLIALIDGFLLTFI